jgi:hypothetical protein
MISNCRLIFVFLILFQSVHSEERIAVLDLEGYGIQQHEAKTLSARLENQLMTCKNFVLLERSKMNEILKEQGFQQTGCTSDECAVEVGRLVNVDHLVTGSVGLVGRVYYLNLKYISVEQGIIERIVEETVRGGIEEVLEKGIVRAAHSVCDPEYKPDTAGSTRPAAPEAPEPAKADLTDTLKSIGMSYNAPSGEWTRIFRLPPERDKIKWLRKYRMRGGLCNALVGVSGIPRNFRFTQFKKRWIQALRRMDLKIIRSGPAEVSGHKAFVTVAVGAGNGETFFSRKFTGKRGMPRGIPTECMQLVIPLKKRKKGVVIRVFSPAKTSKKCFSRADEVINNIELQ